MIRGDVIIQSGNIINYVQIIMKSCYFYIRPSDNPPNVEEIKTVLSEGKAEEKIRVIKEHIKCMVNDDTYPPLIMNMITNITPLLSQYPELRKVMLLYWEVIEKSKSPNDPTLKDEMFLACNSLRSDLLSHNEYLRGRTLRLVSKIMHRGVIEPLSSAIIENIKHKSAYVRRNTVVCLYNVFTNFGSDIIGDIDEEIQELLQTETDLSTKRNAFILLNKSNTKKAMEYIRSQITSESVGEIGDILQLAILKVLKQKAREDPNQRAKFLKIISDFSVKASESVLLECSITSLAISNSVLSIKNSLASYVNILSRTNQLNVKKIILDKLQVVCKNSNYIEEPLLEDLIKGLNTPSWEIKCKIMDIISTGMSFKISELVLKEVKKEMNDLCDGEYILRMVKAIEYISSKFTSNHSEIINIIVNKLFRIGSFTQQCAKYLGNSLKHVLKKSQGNKEYKKQIVEGFKYIESREAVKEILTLFGVYFNQEEDIEMAVTGLQLAIGSLPIEPTKKSKEEKHIEQPEQEKKQKVKTHFKTIVLEDGSYSTQMHHQLQPAEQIQPEKEENHFRNLIAEDSIVGGVFARNVGKMLYKIRKSAKFNKNACAILMILCSLLRNYQQNISMVDQATIDQISTLIRKVINPEEFINSKDAIYEQRQEGFLEEHERIEKKPQVIEKNPSDLIFFRQLKKGAETAEQEFDDEEVNEIVEEVMGKQNFISKLTSMVQLTGYFDPLYAESFVTVNKYDILFEILLMNNTKSNLLNVQIQFCSTSEIIVLEKALSVNLRPFESVRLRSQIRFNSGEFGSIYGYINFDNQAGLQQPYLITEEIKIDYMQFIQPAKIHNEDFKSQWLRADKEEVYELTIPSEQKMTFKKIISIVEEKLHCLKVEDYKDVEEDFFANVKLYGKSRLGEDFMINASFFKDKKIDTTFKVRSKDQAVLNMIMKRLKEVAFETEETEENSQ